MNNIQIRNKGLSGYQIKLMAMVFMVLDHIYYYFSFTNLIPISFRWVGRVVAILFIYMSVEGYLYTRNLKKYLLRLYIGSIFMNISNSILVSIFPRPDNIVIMHSMFSTLFLVLIHIYFFDNIKSAIKDSSIKNIIIYFLLLISPTILSILVFINIDIIPFNIFKFIMIFIPNVFFAEGGLTYILLGLLLYINRNSKLKQMICIFLFSMLSLVNVNLDINTLFYKNYQWMSVFSIIFIALYNGKKGGEDSKLNKYFFYFFYPLHAYILYILSSLIYKF